MGSSSSKQNIWPPTKLFHREHRQKSSKKRPSKHGNGKNPPPPVAPMYDTVADFPVYAVVDKSGKKNNAVEENVQYAEIEVIKQQRGQTKKKPPILPKPTETTEYATLNFPPQRSPSLPSKVDIPKRNINTPSKDREPHRYNPGNGTLV